MVDCKIFIVLEPIEKNIVKSDENLSDAGSKRTDGS